MSVPTTSIVTPPSTNAAGAGGSPTDVIVAETSRLCAQIFKGQLQAAVLTGSLARAEGTFILGSGGHRLLGDVEFLLVFQESVPLPSDADLELLVGKLKERFRDLGIQVSLSLGSVHARYFRGVPPSIFGYELRECGKVVWGDETILKLIPAFPASDIPQEDGWRLLANRLVEQLEGLEELAAHRPALSPETHYRTVKLYLDLATSFLIFTGGYAPTYRERAHALSLLPALGRDAWPFALTSFADDVTQATRWKLDATEPAEGVAREFWGRAIDYAERLWHWELARLTGGAAGRPTAEMLRVWMRRQPLGARLRGWGHVARRQGLRHGLRRWPRWLRSAKTTSPRYAVYAVAAPLVFALRHPELAVCSRGDGDGEDISRFLPEAGRKKVLAGCVAQHRLAADILWNYRRFLVDTRA